jgi:hypothetical protein
VADVFRFPNPPPPPPKNIHRATFFQVQSVSGRLLTCAAYETEFGLELRLSYPNDNLMRSELFRGANRDERLAERVDAWRLALLEKGFTVIDT